MAGYIEKVYPYRCIAVVGGGGKTSLIFHLARLLTGQGKKVIVATSTHMARDSNHPFALWGDKEQLCRNLLSLGYSVVGVPEEVTEEMTKKMPGKITCPIQPDWDSLLDCCDTLLVEADGAHGRPLKVPAAHEPVIPAQAQLVIGVVGLDALDQTIAEGCHRPELTAALLGRDMEHWITEEDIAKICLAGQGLRKGVEERAFWIVLNKADDEEIRGRGEKIRKKIVERSPGQRVKVTSLKMGKEALMKVLDVKRTSE